MDLVTIIYKIAPEFVKKIISNFRNRPYVRVTAELGIKTGIHAVAIHRNRI